MLSPAAMGLCLNMAGVALAFFVGFPQPSHEEGVALGLQDATPLPSGETVAQHNTRVRQRRRVYISFSHLALGLMLVGFLLQLIDLFIKGQ
jgi:hypothetical protein